jgi:hypothetical protein
MRHSAESILVAEFLCDYESIFEISWTNKSGAPGGRKSRETVPLNKMGMGNGTSVGPNTGIRGECSNALHTLQWLTQHIISMLAIFFIEVLCESCVLEKYVHRTLAVKQF